MSDPAQGFSDEDFGLVVPEQKQKQPVESGASTSGNGFSDADIGLSNQVNQPIPVGKDVAKSAAAGAEMIIPSIVGLPGDVQNLYRAGTQYAFEKAMGIPNAIQDWWSGSDTPESMERKKALEARIAAGKKIEENRPKINFPTSHGIAEAVEPYVESVTGVSPLYQPETTAGRYTKTGVEFLGPGLIGKEKLGQKVVQSLTGAAGSETAGTVAKEFLPEYETAARVLGGFGGVFGGGKLAQTTKEMVAPTAAAEEKIAAVTAKARQEGRAPTQAEINAAIQEGAPVTVMDVTGTAGRNLASEATSMGEEARQTAMHMNDFLEARRKAAYGRIDQQIDSILGREVNPSKTQAAIDSAQAIENPQNYRTAMSDPRAANVFSNEISQVASQPIVKKAVDDAAKVFNNQVLPDLKFWDEVKRNLDSQIQVAYRQGDNNLAKNLKVQREKLVNSLDKQVPSYAQARDAASEFFGAENALAAGHNFSRNIKDFNKLNELTDALKKYTPEQRELFAEGFASSIKMAMEKPGQAGPLLDKILQPSQFDKLQTALGKNRAEQIVGMLQTERLLDNMKNIQFLEAAKGGYLNDLFASSGTGILSAFAHGDITTGMVVGAGTMLATGVRRAGLNFAERRVMNEAIKILESGNPDTIQRISEMAAENRFLRPALHKINQTIENQLKTMVSVGASTADREKRKSGGRVNTDAERMIRDAHRTKNLISNNTENLLTLPDDAIISALDTAKKSLGGPL